MQQTTIKTNNRIKENSLEKGEIFVLAFLILNILLYKKIAATFVSSYDSTIL